MFRSWPLSKMLTFAMLISTTVFALHAYSSGKSDEVFIDEGDGDFDSMPIPPKGAITAPKKAAEPIKVAEPEKAAEPVKVAEPEKPEAQKAPVTAAVETPKETHAAKKAAAPKTAKAKKKQVTKSETPAKPAKVAKKEKSAKKSAGIYVTTKANCKMTREPASESPQMITVKPAKKIWVEKVDDKWVRAYNKAGEPGYIDRSCLE